MRMALSACPFAGDWWSAELKRLLDVSLQQSWGVPACSLTRVPSRLSFQACMCRAPLLCDLL